MMGKVHIGISGWSYPDWRGLFYPTGLKSTEWLQFYAQSFDTTELNSSFYHLPKAQTALNWAQKVPPGFTFCPKMSKYLTHIQKLKDPEEPLQRFFDVFAPIKEHLGPILIQLPPSLKFEHDLVKYFFDVLKRDYTDYDFALEARSDTWLTVDALNLMKEYNVAWVISQSGVGFPYAEQVTAKNVYVRFHGPETLYQSRYTDEMMVYYADEMKAWLHAGHNVWVYFNNCYYGNAIDNARTLMQLIG